MLKETVNIGNMGQMSIKKKKKIKECHYKNLLLLSQY